MRREPIVAGSFYKQEESALRGEIRNFVHPGYMAEDALGVVVPHAGYMYSGKVAGAVYSKVRITETVIVISPNHTGRGKPFALWPEGSWATPLGDVPVDEVLSAALLEGSGLLDVDTAAHLHEHSLEVQLPFLQYFRDDVKIVPITVNCDDESRLCLLGMEIAGVLIREWKTPELPPLIVASSDMTHYEHHDHAKRKDSIAIEAIKRLDAIELFDVVHKHKITMCGYAPAIAMICACKELGAQSAELVEYSTSGYVTGDYSSVVGYAGIVVR